MRCQPQLSSRPFDALDPSPWIAPRGVACSRCSKPCSADQHPVEAVISPQSWQPQGMGLPVKLLLALVLGLCVLPTETPKAMLPIQDAHQLSSLMRPSDDRQQ